MPSRFRDKPVPWSDSARRRRGRPKFLIIVPPRFARGSHVRARPLQIDARANAHRLHSQPTATMFLESFSQDVRIGLRVLIKEKGFCALAVTVLALGICAVTTQFSIVNGVILRGFSFPNADRLMSVQFIDPSPAQPNFFGNNSQ